MSFSGLLAKLEIWGLVIGVLLFVQGQVPAVSSTVVQMQAEFCAMFGWCRCLHRVLRLGGLPGWV